MKRFAILALLAVASLAWADSYQINNVKIDETKVRGLMRTVTELLNSTNKSLSYYYTIDKEKCFRWNVSLSVLRSFNLGSAQSWCRSTGTYTTTGSLDAGQRLRVYAQAWSEYATYLAQRIRVYDDGSSEVVDSQYATLEENYEHYWRVVR